MTTLKQLINHLENSIERAEDNNWCALYLSVEEAQRILPDLIMVENYYSRSMDRS